MPERVMTKAETERFLRHRPAAVERSADAQPPQPQCPACGAFVAEDAQYSPNVCANCDAELPPDPDKAAPGKSARPWRQDSVWVEAIADAVARHTKLQLDIRDAQIAELRREIDALKAKAKRKRTPKETA